MKQLTINQVLVYYDGPELVMGTDQVGTRHLGLLVGQDEAGGKYLAVPVSIETVLSLLAGTKDLRAIYEAPETGDWFQFTLKDDAGPVQLEAVIGGRPPEAWLPDQGFAIPYITGSDLLLRETTERASAIIHLSLEPPEARQDYRITVPHLVDALQRFQSLVKHAYTKATAATRAAGQAAAEATDSHGLDVFAVSEGSFTVHMQSRSQADLFGFVELERALSKLDAVVEKAGDPEATLVFLKENRGHFAAAYMRFLEFIIKNDSPIRYEWNAPDLPAPVRRKISRDQAGPLYKLLTEKKELTVETVQVVGKVIKANVPNRTFTIATEDGEEFPAIVDERSQLSVSGLVMDTQNYRFSCEERIEEVVGTGRERTRLYLLSYEAI